MADTIRGSLTDNYGRPIVGASVTVYKKGTTNLASLYSDDALSIGMSNPITSGSDGAYGPVFTPNGKYDLAFSAAGYTFTAADSMSEMTYDPAIIRIATGVFTVDDRDVIIYADASGGSVTINLPALATMLVPNRKITVVKVDSSANTVTIVPNGAETINGAANFILRFQYQSTIILSKSPTGWFLLTALPNIIPAFEAVMSADQTFTLNTATKVMFNSEAFDLGGYYDAVSLYRYTPPPGKYLITAAVRMTLSLGVNSPANWMAIYKNGTALRQAVATQEVQSATAMRASITDIVDANGTDYFEIFVRQSSSTGTPVITSGGEGGSSNESLFSAVRVVAS